MDQETPISRERARGAGFWVVLHLMAYYGAAGFAWGLALKSLIWGIAGGVVVGLLLGALFAFPVVTKQSSEEQTKEMMFAVGATWGNLAIVLGIIGIVVWLIRLVF